MEVVSANAVSCRISVTNYAKALVSTAISVGLSTMAAVWKAAAITVRVAKLVVTAIAPNRARSMVDRVPGN